MTQIVLSLEEKSNKKLRKLANELYGSRKGALSEVVEAGIDLVEKEMRRKSAYSKLLYEAKTARNIGIGKFDRAEAYG